MGAKNNKKKKKQEKEGVNKYFEEEAEENEDDSISDVSDDINNEDRKKELKLCKFSFIFLKIFKKLLSIIIKSTIILIFVKNSGRDLKI